MNDFKKIHRPSGSSLFCRLLATSGLFFAGTAALRAFPPAPYYTLYGIVRDQVGQTVAAQGAEIVLLNGSDELARAPIAAGVRLDQNYELKVRLDQNRSGTTLYSEKAVPAKGEFRLVVEMNGTYFYPIEVAGTLTAGSGGERVRLDLNLGEDLDHDGLPDVWEQWQLYQAGYVPDDDGNWPIGLIDRNGDFDHDGMSNWLEYIAGTYAGDATERFALEIKEKTPANTRFAFFAITGKTYTIEASADMKTWARIPFSVGPVPATGAVSWQSQDVAVVTAFAATPADTTQYYRLSVR